LGENETPTRGGGELVHRNWAEGKKRQEKKNRSKRGRRRQRKSLKNPPAKKTGPVWTGEGGKDVDEEGNGFEPTSEGFSWAGRHSIHVGTIANRNITQTGEVI